MFYLWGAIVFVGALWAISEWYTVQTINILLERIRKLEDYEIKRLIASRPPIAPRPSWEKGDLIEAEVHDPSKSGGKRGN